MFDQDYSFFGVIFAIIKLKHNARDIYAMDEKKIGGEPTVADSPEAQQRPKVLGQVKGRRILSSMERLKRAILKKPKRPSKKTVFAIIAGVLILGVLVAGVAGFYQYKAKRQLAQLDKVSEAVANKDTSTAYKLAQQALDMNPNDMDSLLAAATLAEKEDPEESKRLYARILEIQSKEDNPDEDGKTAITYWSAAGLAEKAGKVELARKYYQKALTAVDMKDSYHQFIANDSQTALERLK